MTISDTSGSGLSRDQGSFSQSDDVSAILSPSISAESPLPKRRNGKPQSCEPCRKAKVSCDHGHPKCGRCLKKGIASQCLYHPAPLTRPGSKEDGSISAGVVKRRASPTSRLSNSGVAASNLLLLLSQQRSTVVEREESVSEHSEEYLGPTNYTAIFRETQSQIGAELWRKDRDEEEVPRTLVESNPTYSVSALNIAVDALERFPEQAVCERLLSQSILNCGSDFHGPTVEYASRQFWHRWGSHLRTKNYRPIAEKLLSTPIVSVRTCRNSAEWLQSFTGDNLRFEMIGVCLAMISLGTLTLPVWDPLFDIDRNGRLGKRMFAERVGEGAAGCFDICNAQGFVTEPLIWLTQFLQTARSQYRGDDDGMLWPKTGQVASAITSFGLHREAFVNSAPFLVAELRRRTFAAAYVSDKQLATYYGRPPRLSKRFCSCQLPYDMTDEEIMLEGEQLESKLASLDKDGWATDGIWRETACERILMITAMIREEVLELCLGPSGDVSQARKQELSKRAADAYRNVPERLHLSYDDDKIITTPTTQLIVQILFEIEQNFNSFLILRLPSKDSNTDSQNELIVFAIKILENLELLQRYRDKLNEYLYGQGWWTVYYAIPAASVLSVELLKQHQYPRRYKCNLPRADAIRLLSVYTLCLASVGCDEGNYKICQRMHKIVKRILSEVLEIQRPSEESSTVQTTPGSVMPEVDLSSVMTPNDDPEFMDWLQTVDWTKAPWMDPMGGF